MDNHNESGQVPPGSDAERRWLLGVLTSHSRRLHLTATAANEIAECARITHWSPGDVICRSARNDDVLSFVFDGVVKLCMQTSRGTRVLELVGKGSFVCLAAMLEVGTAGPVWVVSHDDTRVALVARSSVSRILGRLPHENLLLLISRESRRTLRSLAFQCRLADIPLEQRILLHLRRLARRWGRVTDGGVALTLRLMHEDISQIAWASRSQVTRAIKQLIRTGVLSVSDHLYVLTDGTHSAVDRPA